MEQLELLKIPNELREEFKQQLVQLENLEHQVIIHNKAIKEIEKSRDNLKELILNEMIKYDVKTFDTEKLKFTRIDATTRTMIDSARLKQDMPELYSRYQKTSNVKASLRITEKKGD